MNNRILTSLVILSLLLITTGVQGGKKRNRPCIREKHVPNPKKQQITTLKKLTPHLLQFVQKEKKQHLMNILKEILQNNNQELKKKVDCLSIRLLDLTGSKKDITLDLTKKT